MRKNLWKTALVTGASAGIGAEFAKQLNCEPELEILYLCSRRTDRLNSLAEELKQKRASLNLNPISIKVLTVDLREGSERRRLCREVDKDGALVDVLINNAGFGSVGCFSELDLKTELEMIAVNCEAPLELSRHFLPSMCHRKSGTIINIASVCAYQPMPYMATYGATKAFLFSLGTAIAAEVRRDGVSVVTICPGPTESEFHLAAGLDRKLNHVPGMTAEVVVSQALDGAKVGKLVVVNGLGNKLIVLLTRLLPTRISTAITERILRGDAEKQRQKLRKN